MGDLDVSERPLASLHTLDEVAEDAAALSAKYPAITVVGNYSGSLTNRGEPLRLVDAAGVQGDGGVTIEAAGMEQRQDRHREATWEVEEPVAI